MSASAARGRLGVTGGTGKTIKTDIPARLDRLPWSRWHWIVIIALGITWILDGLERSSSAISPTVSDGRSSS